MLLYVYLNNMFIMSILKNMTLIELIISKKGNEFEWMVKIRFWLHFLKISKINPMGATYTHWAYIESR
jgi:hypothetical protein